MKAKYIGKFVDTSYGNYIIHLEYEYRGERYTVFEDRRKGNEPIAWQHRTWQDDIDRTLDVAPKASSSDTVEDALKLFFESFE